MEYKNLCLIIIKSTKCITKIFDYTTNELEIKSQIIKSSHINNYQIINSDLCRIYQVYLAILKSDDFTNSNDYNIYYDKINNISEEILLSSIVSKV